jgi:cysteine-rich repeat protein
MLDRVHPTGRRRAVATVAAAAMLLGPVGSARADSRECRAQIGKEAKALLAMGTRFVDQCHRARDRACVPISMRGECNSLPSSNTDPKGRYVAREAKALANIDADCAGDPVLANYPGGIQDDVLDTIAEEIGGSSQVNLGDEDLLCDQALVRCHRAIAQSRTTVLREVVNDSIKCQRDLDNGGGPLGAISPVCLDTGDRTSGHAANRITKNCTGLTADDVGTCSPLPSCVIESAVATGQGLAQAVYGATPTCGNGTPDDGEQCDDGNTTPGDGCNASCEIEGNTCTPYGGPGGASGTRLVKVSISTPQPLAGLQVSLDYPQFQSGIPGSGTSSVVQTRFTPLQPAGLALMNDTDLDLTVGMVNVVNAFESGDLFEVEFDNCVALSENICNRVQNIISCTGADNPPACGTAPPPGVVGACSNPGGCPGDNFCIDQTAVTGCSVSDPVDDLGQPVAGVTCAVTITEIP